MKSRMMRLAPVLTYMPIAALIAFGQLGCEENIRPVRGFSAEPVNIAATQLKARCIEILRQGVHSEKMDIRLRVALALSSIGDPAGLKDARALMGGRRRQVGLRVAHYFARNGLTPSSPAIIDSEATVRKAKGGLRYLAITVLGHSTRQGAVKLIRSIMDDVNHPDLQVCAACALARRADTQGIEWLQKNVQHWLAFRGFDPFLFGKVADESVMLKLMNALRAGVDHNIRNAILAAEATRDSRATSYLPILLTRKHGVRKTMAAAVLAELGGGEGDSVLKKVVSHPMPVFPEAAWAAMGLGSLGDPSGIWALVKFLEREGASAKGTKAASLILPCLESPGYAVSASFQLWISVNI